MASECWIAAVLFALSCAYLFAFRRYVPMDPDEGIVLQGAARILRGEVLYRDFFSFFTPGSYYWLAVLFKIFGESLIVARTALLVYGGLFTAFTYFMARRTCPRWIAMAMAYIATIACLPWRFMALHNWDSSLLFCLALYCAVLILQAPRSEWAFGLGSFVSLTFLFEQSKGAGLIVGLLFGFSLIAWLRLADLSPLRTAKSIFALAAGIAWPVVLTIVYFASHHALSASLADISWPLHHYGTVNKVPYGWADWSDETRANLFPSRDRIQTIVALIAVTPCFILPALPIFGLLLVPRWLIAVHRRKLNADRAAFYVLLGGNLAGALLSILAVRANIVHFVYIAPLLYVVLAWLLDGRDAVLGLARSVQPIVSAIVLLTFTSAGLALLIANRDSRSMLATRRGLVRTPASDELISYLQTHVPPNEKLFVYPYFPLAYFLTATFNPTRYEYLQPGMHTREQDLEAIRAIEESRTTMVLFEPSFYEKVATSWPNTPLSAFSVDPVTDYIVRNYHSCANLQSGNARMAAGGASRFSFMLRDGLPCPSSK